MLQFPMLIKNSLLGLALFSTGILSSSPVIANDKEAMLGDYAMSSQVVTAKPQVGRQIINKPGEMRSERSFTHTGGGASTGQVGSFSFKSENTINTDLTVSGEDDSLNIGSISLGGEKKSQKTHNSVITSPVEPDKRLIDRRCKLEALADEVQKQQQRAQQYKDMTEAVDKRNEIHQAIGDAISAFLSMTDLLTNISEKGIEELLLPLLEASLEHYEILADDSFISAIIQSSISLIGPSLEIIKAGGSAAEAASTLNIASVALDAAKVFSNGATAWYISEDTERLNETTIANDFLSYYYSTGEDENAMALDLGLSENASHKDIVAAWAEKLGFKNDWLPGEDYNLNSLIELIAFMRDNVDSNVIQNCGTQ